MPAVAMPPVVTWEIRELKSGKPRTFEQVELSIDGEVRLVQLASKTIQILSEMPMAILTGIKVKLCLHRLWLKFQISSPIAHVFF